MNIRHTLFLLFVCCFGFAQTQQWGSYYSYTNVVAMAQNNTRMFAASGSAVFSQNSASGELKTITSVEGLKADGITAMHFSADTGRLLVGNSTGLLLVVNSDGSVVNKIDIVQETNVPYNKKAINRIYENNGMAYLSCDFGIVQFNVNTLQFGDTYSIGPGGGLLKVNQCAIHQGYIYAATESGILRASAASANLIDYNEWSQVVPGNWTGLISFNNKLIAASATGDFVTVNNNTTSGLAPLPSAILDLREANGFMVATSAEKVVVYDNALVQQYQINTVGEPAVFSAATVVGRNLYVGTTEKGVYSIDLNTFLPTNITPNGPLRSNIYALKKSANALWAVYGFADVNFDPKLRKYGVSKLSAGTGWTNIPYTTLQTINGVTKDITDIVDVLINPTDEKQVYLLSSGSGMLKLTDMVPAILYDETNSGIENQMLVSNYRTVRVQSGVFDRQGTLWIMNGLTKKPLKKLTGTSWTPYSFESVYPTPQEMQYKDIVIDDSGTKWIASGTTYGLIGFNETANKFMRLTTANELPDNYVMSLAIDKSGRMWIGTRRGLRVIYSTQRFLSEDVINTSQVIIEEDGVAQELMYAQTINDIEIDGSDNKWFGTDTAGAFLVSPDGQRTLYHFTKDNSPLPSNTINDIAIDNTTGEVFFATDKGMVSFKGSSTAAANDLNSVYAYPNPVRPGYEGDVKITNLTDKANVKITDIEGNLVYETTSEGGTITWDTTAFGKYKVRSGVYMVFISSEDTTMKAVRKIMVIRGN